MKVSCVLAIGLVCGMGAVSASALNTPTTPTTSHAKSKETHLSAAHSAPHHAHTASAHRATVVRRSAARTVSTTSRAHLRHTVLIRHHRYYERFTASSFVTGTI